MGGWARRRVQAAQVPLLSLLRDSSTQVSRAEKTSEPRNCRSETLAGRVRFDAGSRAGPSHGSRARPSHVRGRGLCLHSHPALSSGNSHPAH